MILNIHAFGVVIKSYYVKSGRSDRYEFLSLDTYTSQMFHVVKNERLWLLLEWISNYLSLSTKNRNRESLCFNLSDSLSRGNLE